MSRYTAAQCRLCRREGVKLLLKGEKCLTPKCVFEHRDYPPGMHNWRRGKVSDFGLQLREKQKVKRYYGVLEKQFRRFFDEATRLSGNTGENLLVMLESRLDNVVYRMGLAASRPQARQLVRHGHFEVNGRKVNIPSFLVQQGDIVAVRPNSQRNTFFKDLAQDLPHRSIPEWLSRDDEALTGRVMALPERKDIDVSIDEHLIVEYYSR